MTIVVKPVNFPLEYEELKNEINSALESFFKSGVYVLGKKVEEFEDKLSKYVGVKYCVGVASGTDALTISIKALGLGKGDGVIIPANVYPTSFGVTLSGVDIQLADVDPDTFNIDLKNIKKSVRKNTKAVVIVHLYGNPVDILPVKKYCKEKGLYLIEDCAQAIGATYKSKKVGGFGDMSCFSFYPTKNLGAYGDGGAILTNNKKLFEKAKILRMYGEKDRYDSVLLGHNSRLDELHSTLLLVKLKYLNKNNLKRKNIAKKYFKELRDLPIGLAEVDTKDSVFHLFVIKTKDRSNLMNYLKKKGIGVGIHYPTPIHLVRSYLYLGYKKGSFPVSEKLSSTILSLPIYPQMEEKQVRYVIDSLKEYFKKQ